MSFILQVYYKTWL